MTTVASLIHDGRMSRRLWFYTNYNCNLACSYCLTESSPRAPRRQLDHELIRALATQAAELGFEELGVTGGEPFLDLALPETLATIADVLPVIVLTNGTLFGGSRMDRLAVMLGHRVTLQISLDSADPDLNDLARGPDNFAKVVDAVPRLIAAGHRVRIASTGQASDEDAQERLCALHRAMGVGDDDHVVRPIVRRGRGIAIDGALPAGAAELFPELTVTADGAFWSPFGPTVVDVRVDTDLLISRTVDPLRVPAERIAALVSGRPVGADVALNIR
jgi:MoaA/NifB/PqqE/SkfB family radical SAM enzyme